MGSVAFDGEDESQLGTSNGKKYKLPRTLLDDCGAVNYASVPRKLRSAIKNWGREAVTPPSPIARKQYHVSNGVKTVGKNSAKKSKLNTKKRGHITKDEEEVAQTLYALADMFSDANKPNQPGSHDELPHTKSSEAGTSMHAVEDTHVPTVEEDSRKISSKVTLEAACDSPTLVGSTAEVVKFQSSSNAQQPEMPSNEQPATPMGRPRVSMHDVAPSSDQVTTTGIQSGKNHHPVDENNGLSSRSLNETRGSCLRLPTLLDSRNPGSKPQNSSNAEKYNTHIMVERKKSWKRCSAHVYICRLIKVLQVSEAKEGLLEKPTQLTPSGGAEQQPNASDRNGSLSFSGVTQSTAEKDSENDILLPKKVTLPQDQPLASETSVLCSSTKQQGYDFLSLGSGVCGLDGNEGVNRAGHGHEDAKQIHMSYMQSQNHSTMLFSGPQNGYSSTFHSHNSALPGQQVQLPQYLSNNTVGSFTGITRQQQQLESQQRQKWPSQLQTQYTTTHLPEWRNGGRNSSSMINYAHALFPHLHAALGSKYQQLSPQQQQQQLMAMNSSLPLKRHHHHHLTLGFERNGTALYPENIPQLHEHL